MAIQIPLTRGLFAIVDDDVGPGITAYKWSAVRGRRGNFYAARTSRDSQPRKTILMHRAILQAPGNMLIDHIDGDGLNNTRLNLRFCTFKQNARNKKHALSASSPYKGIFPDGNRWRAKIVVDRVPITLGSFATPEEAHAAYAAAAIEFHGEFARLA